MNIRDINGTAVVTKTLLIGKSNQSFNHKMEEYCFHRITERRELNLFLTWMEAIIKQKSSYITSNYVGFYTIKWTLQLSIVVWIANKAVNFIS